MGISLAYFGDGHFNILNILLILNLFPNTGPELIIVKVQIDPTGGSDHQMRLCGNGCRCFVTPMKKRGSESLKKDIKRRGTG